MLALTHFSLTLAIMSFTLSHSDGTVQPNLLGPKLIVVMKRLTEKGIEALTAGIWYGDSCGKVKKFIFDDRSSF